MEKIYPTLASLVDRLDRVREDVSPVIGWGSPVPVFGRLGQSRVASLGLNPSNREFVDRGGQELEGVARRFHTLSSLSLDCWADADLHHLRMILETCQNYFDLNPYDRWFRVLDRAISSTSTSYYSSVASACHLDLIPFATARKWAELNQDERRSLLELTGDALGKILRDSPVKILILNGISVVRFFERAAGVSLECKEMSGWELPRRNSKGVQGLAFRGVVDNFGAIHLARRIEVIGFNHNLQSSFGVTRRVLDEINSWIGEVAGDVFEEERS